MSGQITLTELSVMITLGAIVSPIMQLPDRGIVFGIVVLGLAVAFQRGINWWGVKNEKVEKVVRGEVSMLVKDGTLILEEMAKTQITKQQLFSMLREKKIPTLGKVERVYIEACGFILVPKDVIHQAVYLKLRFSLSYRNIEEMLCIRGVAVGVR